MEEAAANAGPIPPHLPLSVAALMAWEDFDLGVCAWTSPNIASASGRHRDLRLRFDQALQALKARMLPRGRREVVELRSKLGASQQRERRLKEQNAGLMIKLLKLESDLAKEAARARSARAELEERHSSTARRRPPRLRDVSKLHLPEPSDG